jgi:hypothetical protein
MRKIFTPIGTRFGSWTVIGSDTSNKWGNAMLPCRCDCGKEIDVLAADLRNGRSGACRSCCHSKGEDAKRRQKIAWLLREKSQPCTDCGRTFPPYCMQFDHVPERGEKSLEMNNRAVSNKYTLDEWDIERKKCDLVCSVCHDHRTWERANRLPHTPLEMI